MVKELELSFSDKEITPWGGMALMSRMLQKIEFNPELSLELKYALLSICFSNGGH